MIHSRRFVSPLCFAVLSALGCSKAEKAPPTSNSYVTVSESAVQGRVRTNLDSPAPTRAQLERKERTRRIITGLGLPWLETLPVVEDDASVTPRTSEEVAERCLATEFCAVRAEGRDRALALELVERFGTDSALSPNERKFLLNEAPPEQDIVNFAWGYEHTHVLLWALGYLDELKPPNQIADVPREAALIREKGPKEFRAGARLRTTAEFLDQADLYYRLHWALVDLRLKGLCSDKADEEIVSERHKALNWLIRYMNQAWDDVTTDT